MPYSTLISTAELQRMLGRDDLVVVDCRFLLNSPELGESAYISAHIPGAVFAHLERDLSGPPSEDRGRHPLPSTSDMCQLFGRLGIDSDSQVVAYDDINGPIAARLWWMLRYMGHDAVAVLDSGWTGWLDAGLPVQGGWEVNSYRLFKGVPRTDWLVHAEQVSEVPLLIDSRSPDRFRGENETLDFKPGHIPGAINYFYEENWTARSGFKEPEMLARQFKVVIGTVDPAEVVFYCGSGVTACNNLLAMFHAGLGNARLYAGSWSDWITQPDRPIELGE